MKNDLTVVFLTLVGYTTITYLGLKLIFRIIDKMMRKKEDDKTRSNNNGTNNSK